MASLSLLKFDTPGGAQQMLTTLEALEKQKLIEIQDAAIVTWAPGKKKPTIRQHHGMTTVFALDGAFWGLLLGIIFLVPLLGIAVGAALGALAGHFARYGIDDDFIKSAQDKITEGTSGLFLITSDAMMDKIVPLVQEYKFEIVQTSLSPEQEAKLRAEFGDAPA